MSPITLLVIWILAMSTISSWAVEVRKGEYQTIPEEFWQTTETVENVRTKLQCAVIADSPSRNTYYHSYNKQAKECRLGYADRSALGTGGSRLVAGGSKSNFTQFGLVHGNEDGNTEFDIVMPSGKICSPEEHGIPAFDGGARYKHGILEVGGVIYLIGGHGHSDCYKLDLNSANPSWTPIASMPNPATPTTGGVISHVDSNGDLFLYVFFLNMCYSSSASDGYIRRYNVQDDAWSTQGRTNSRKGFGGPAVLGDYVFLAGGFSCDNNWRRDEVQRWDMNDPTAFTVELQHKLCVTTNHWLTCQIHYMSGRPGLLCAGSFNTITNTESKTVQFVPLNEEDGTTAGNCQPLDPLPEAKAWAFLFAFGNGQLALYGGEDSSTTDGTSPSIFLWRPDLNQFTDEDQLVAARSVKSPAFAHISQELVISKCWKHL